MRGEGAAQASMVGGMIGTVVNIVLDPIFILTLDMGTAGAAIATVLGNVCGCLYYLWYFARRSPLLSIHPRDLHGGRRQMGKVLSIGLPAGANSALMSIATVLLNNALVQYGDDPVAAMGIVTKAYMLIAFIHMGIANGIQPLLGYCFGAGLRQRFLSILKFSGVLTVVCGAVLSAVYIVFSRQVVALFIDDAEVIAYGGPMLIATSIAGPILGILFLSINSMQAMNRPLPATLLSVCRQGLIFIPALYLLGAAFGLDGINFTQAVADYLSILIAVWLLLRSLKAFRAPEAEKSFCRFGRTCRQVVTAFAAFCVYNKPESTKRRRIHEKIGLCLVHPADARSRHAGRLPHPGRCLILSTVCQKARPHAAGLGLSSRLDRPVCPHGVGPGPGPRARRAARSAFPRTDALCSPALLQFLLEYPVFSTCAPICSPSYGLPYSGCSSWPWPALFPASTAPQPICKSRIWPGSHLPATSTSWYSCSTERRTRRPPLIFGGFFAALRTESSISSQDFQDMFT